MQRSGSRSAGRTLFLDSNNNGALDTGERSTVSDPVGNYAFTSLSAKTYTVREALSGGFTITKPTGGSYVVPVTLGTNVTGKDFGNKSGTTLPTLSIVATDATATEPATASATASDTGVYTISRSGATTSALNFSYTISGTATNGIDYTLSETASIPASAASTTITLTPKFDTLAEGSETAILTLASSASYTIDSTKKSATVTIKGCANCEVTSTSHRRAPAAAVGSLPGQ